MGVETLFLAKTCNVGQRLLLMTNKKLQGVDDLKEVAYALSSRLVPNATTLDYPKRHVNTPRRLAAHNDKVYSEMPSV